MNLGKTIGQLCSFLENKGLFQPRFLGGRGLKNEFSEPDVIKEQKSTGHTLKCLRASKCPFHGVNFLPTFEVLCPSFSPHLT